MGDYEDEEIIEETYHGPSEEWVEETYHTTPGMLTAVNDSILEDVDDFEEEIFEEVWVEEDGEQGADSFDSDEIYEEEDYDELLRNTNTSSDDDDDEEYDEDDDDSEETDEFEAIKASLRTQAQELSSSNLGSALPQENPIQPLNRKSSIQSNSSESIDIGDLGSEVVDFDLGSYDGGQSQSTTEEPEDYEQACRDLIKIVYRGQTGKNVDADDMIRRCDLPSLYRNLKEQHKHNCDTRLPKLERHE